jgi:hypothetical protein
MTERCPAKAVVCREQATFLNQVRGNKLSYRAEPFPGQSDGQGTVTA